jgi:hypothetical protein
MEASDSEPEGGVSDTAATEATMGNGQDDGEDSDEAGSDADDDTMFRLDAHLAKYFTDLHASKQVLNPRVATRLPLVGVQSFCRRAGKPDSIRCPTYHLKYKTRCPNTSIMRIPSRCYHMQLVVYA